MDEIKDHSIFPITNTGEGVPFDRIRRITGYLAGSLEKWNDSKRAEEADRVKHNVDTP